jgi:hypothetical protein
MCKEKSVMNIIYGDDCKQWNIYDKYEVPSYVDAKYTI